MNRLNCTIVCNGDFKGAGTFKIACRIILQLNVISVYSERGLKSVVTHTKIPYTELSSQNELASFSLYVPICEIYIYNEHIYICI